MPCFGIILFFLFQDDEDFKRKRKRRTRPDLSDSDWKVGTFYKQARDLVFVTHCCNNADHKRVFERKTKVYKFDAVGKTFAQGMKEDNKFIWYKLFFLWAYFMICYDEIINSQASDTFHSN